MNGMKNVCEIKIDNTCGANNQDRRICLKSQPVRFVDQSSLTRGRRILVSTTAGDKRSCKKLQNNNHRVHVQQWNMLESDKMSVHHPDIYIDPERDDNCVTTVRRTTSKIKWSKPIKKSKYHKKCAEKENITRRVEKHKPKRKTLISDSDIDEMLISEAKARHKFSNECYCTDVENVPSASDVQKPVKPLIISDDRKKHYSINTLKKTRKLIDYDPESEFLKRLKKGMKKAFDCKCSECMLDKLEKSFKYTSKRALLEETYQDVPEPETYIPRPDRPKNVSCSCKICNTSQIRKNNYFETHSIADLQRTISPHKCVHKFTLDERLLPRPVHTDCWGHSRCDVCSKPYQMADKESQMPSRLDLCDRCVSAEPSAQARLSNKSVQPSANSLLNSSQRDLQQVPSCSRCAGCSMNSRLSMHIGAQTCICGSVQELSPCKSTSCHSLAHKLSSACRKINICDKGTVVELDTEAALLESKSLSSNKFFEKCKKMKVRPRVLANNTLALRYQKGVL